MPQDLVCEHSRLHKLYYADDKDQVAGTIILILPQDKQTETQQKVLESFDLGKCAKDLLVCAKRVVEITIERDEQAAIDWLESVSQVVGI